MSTLLLIKGNIIHCISNEVELINNGFVIVKDGKISQIGNNSDIKDEQRYSTIITLKTTQILIPGLIDAHIHAPQYPNVGLGYDKTLLDWLSSYTYKTEAKYNDLDFSSLVYNALVRKSLSYGTTTACYFGSLFRSSTLKLVDAIIQHGQRALVGKINMTKLAPDNYIESDTESIDETRKFINQIKLKNNDLVMPIITPRFAPSVDIELMKKLAKIAQEENLHIQSHISENCDELKLVEDIFKHDYAVVYDMGGMLTEKTILAHGIYLKNSELELLKKRGTSIAHCPSSNTLLKSGLCDIRKLWSYGIDVGLGTDVSGGASPSIIEEMRSAIATSIHLSFGKDNYEPLTYKDVFYLATLGAAKALSLDSKIGNFEIGKDFDALIIDMNVKNSSVDYFDNCDPMELLQKFVFVGDDRNVQNVFVKGKNVK